MIILNFTPGLDSFLSNWILTKQNKGFKRVYFHLKGLYNNIEIDVLRSNYPPNYFDVNYDLSIENFEEKDAHAPNRNLLLVTLAQSLYGADEIYLGGVKDDRTEDQGSMFYKKATDVLTQCADKPVVVKSALIEKEKSVWCKEYAEENPKTKLDLLTKTYSCFDRGNSPIYKLMDIYEKYGSTFRKVGETDIKGCLKCPACYRRLAALTGANIYTPFNNFKMASEYVDKIDPKELPNRYISAINYATFLEYLDFV